MNEAPDIREQEDCPSGEVCEWSCDQHVGMRDGYGDFDPWEDATWD